MSRISGWLSRSQTARARFATCVMAFGLNLIGTAHATDVLILSDYQSLGAGSVVNLVVTRPTNMLVTGSNVTGLGMTSTLVTPAQWPSANYASYKVIVLSFTTSWGGVTDSTVADTNAALWAAGVQGNVVIIGSDPGCYCHEAIGGAQLWKSAIAFAASGPQTGAVIALGGRYNTSPAGTHVPSLQGFESSALGHFEVQGTDTNKTHIIASSPALAGLNDALLSNWDHSAHNGFTTWPSDFIPLAVETDSALGPLRFYDGIDSETGNPVKGLPYILARGVTPTTLGILKLCKIAGAGISPGTPFTFTAGSSTLSVPAGQAPGGTCKIGPTVAAGTTIAVSETIPLDGSVSRIAVAPGGRLVGQAQLSTGTTNVIVGPGITEVTYTNTRPTGFLEICKGYNAGPLPPTSGSATFTVNPGALGPITVPAGACSPAIEVAAGQVVITEAAPSVMVACSAIPVSRQIGCNTAARKSTVFVAAGDVSAQTIANITNDFNLNNGGGGQQATLRQ